ncbi:MAG: phosphatidate cytidylyltransferase [Acutalibacteraceae bacterium]
MAPEISPKKTVEGAVGGIVAAILGMLIACLIFNRIKDDTANTVLLVAITPVLAFAGMMGDLIASYIKRACGIKDYGKIMPGHGGILDRFDSVVTVIPLMYIVVTHCPVLL